MFGHVFVCLSEPSLKRTTPSGVSSSRTTRCSGPVGPSYFILFTKEYMIQAQVCVYYPLTTTNHIIWIHLYPRILKKPLRIYCWVHSVFYFTIQSRLGRWCDQVPPSAEPITCWKSMAPSRLNQSRIECRACPKPRSLWLSQYGSSIRACPKHISATPSDWFSPI